MHIAALRAFRITLAIFVASSLTMVTLGQTAEAKKKPSTTTTTAVPIVVVAPEQITSMMLGLSDMPIGWSSVNVPDSPASATGGFCNGPNALARAQALGLKATQWAAFTQDPNL